MMDSNPTRDNLLIQAYTPAGFKVSINLAGLPTAHEVDLMLKEAGYVNQLPGVEAGENVETITTVVRREHTNKKDETTPVVDCYPDWRGDYGQYRFVSIYLNNPAEIAEFEAQSGLKLWNIPLYESQAPLKRNPSKPAKQEVTCKTSFRVKKAPDKEKEIDGKMQMTYRFSGYLSPINPPAAQPESKPTGSTGGGVPESMGKLSERGKTTARPTFADNQELLYKMVQYSASEGFEGDDLLKALNLPDFNAIYKLPCDDEGRAKIKADIAKFKALAVQP